MECLRKLETRLYINGSFQEADEKLHLLSPTDDTPLPPVSKATENHVDLAVTAALAAFPAWDNLGFLGRKPFLFKLAALMRENVEDFAAIEALNLGRHVQDTIGEVMFTSGFLEYFADAAQDVIGESRIGGAGMVAMEMKQPYGVVAAILPFNAPITMFCWKVGTALATGNTVVVKSSEKAPFSSLKFASLIHAAGFPPGVVNVLSGDGPSCGAALAAHKDVRRLSFTGSTATGRIIQEIAAKTNFKTVSLEMGGKSASLIFADADLEKAAMRTAASIGWLAGQTCYANSRILVEETCAEKFLRLFKNAFEGSEALLDPKISDAGKFVPPVIDQKQMNKILGYIEKGRKQCEPLTGGYRIGDKGCFVAKTIFYNLPAESEVVRDEIFGPVVCINSFKTEDQAVAMANDTKYGLYASVFTRDISRAMRVAKRLETGILGINTSSPDICPGSKFSGWKTSGSGPRDGMKAGLESMVESKTVSIRFE